MHSIDELKNLPKKDLLELWQKLPGKQVPPARIGRLLAELAYRIQEQRYGKLDKNTSVSLSRHMAAFEKSLEQGKVVAPVKSKSKVRLESGSLLSRQWEGQTITVRTHGIRDFEFEGVRYKSLTAIAKLVTGQHMSGPLFFGLKEVKRG